MVVTREPGGTEIGEAIRHTLQHAKAGEMMCPETEILLFAASRAQLVREVIRPALESGTHVISDRFFDSTTVYQGLARRLPGEAVAWLNAFAVDDCVPNVTFLMDLSAEVARERVFARSGAEPDRFEREPIEFYARVRDGFLAEAARHPDRMCVIDAAATPDAIAKEIWNHLQEVSNGIFV